MPDYDRDCFRLASVLQQALRRLHAQEAAISLPWWEFQHCQDLHRKLERARSRKWALAAATLSENLEIALCRLHDLLAGLLAEQRRRSGRPGVPPLKSLYQEVRALFEEFDNVEYDLKRRQITVTTEPVELDEVYLGEFAICLDLNDLGKSHAYHVIAKDPQPAAANGSVTHPHVQDQYLCEGEGTIPIQRALAAGRLCDFFQIVNQILHTYNSGSAYVQLDNWSGVHCGDCGSTVPADDVGCCDRCEASLCEECGFCCNGCDNRLCAACSHDCLKCGERFCTVCLTPCEACEDEFCQSCLSNGKCKICHDRNSTEIQSRTQSGTRDDLAVVATVVAGPPAANETDPALHPAGMEQAPLPA